jgi:class 3 adenylate cyclase/predicted ATPase
MEQPHTTEIDNLLQAIAALDAQRAILGDATVDAALAPLKDRLATLQAESSKPAETTTAERRRQVVVLFADVFGFTALSEKLDAEDITDLINNLWLALDTIIIAQGGHIDKHMGDGVMALWGVEQSREDDIERAVRAALAMQQAIRAWGEEKRPVFVRRGLLTSDGHDLPLAMRIGIHYGSALLGEIGKQGEFSVIGDTVNTASRLESAAAPGSVLISQPVYRAVRGIFDVRALGPLTMKGKSEPMPVYEVERLRPRAFRMGTRGIEGIETQMVGRQREFEQLKFAYEGMRLEGNSRLVTLTGDAGIGKSRLLYEFLRWLDTRSGHSLYKARADEEMQRIPYGLLRDLFSARFDILESDTSAAVREKLRNGFGGAGLPEAQSDTIARWLGYEIGDSLLAQPGDARQLRNNGLQALTSYFRQLAGREALILLLDDLHWADDSSLDIILYLAQSLAGHPVLFICSSRPVLYERRSMWGDTLERHIRIELNPLGPQASQDLVSEIFQKASEVPESLRDLIVRNSEGNPFYVEELVKMLLDDRVILKESDPEEAGEVRWRVDASRIGSLRVPATLNGILQARFDSLPAEERYILQQAAVIGRIFWEDTLRHIYQRDPEHPGEPAAIQQVLSDLRRREMVFARADSTFHSTREYIFKHALLRDAVYESILKRVRRNYHALVADWLIHNSAAGRSSEVTGLIADHLEQAGDDQRACTYLKQAGMQAAAKFANAEALDFFTRALHLAHGQPAAFRFDLLLARESILDLQGERQRQQQDLQDLAELARELADPQRQAQAALRQAHFYQQTSDYTQAIACAQQVLDVNVPVEMQAEARLELGRAFYRQANYQQSRQELEHALQLARPDSGLTAEILQSLTIATLYQGDTEASQDYLEQTRAIVRKTGNRQVEANLLHTLGVMAIETRPDADIYFNQSLEIYREIGDRRGEAYSLQQLGLFYDRRNRFEQATECYSRAYQLHKLVGDLLGQGWMLNALGSLAQYQGKYAQARPFFEQALEIYLNIHVPWGQAISLHNLGVTFLALGQTREARENLQRALEICQAAGDIWGEIWRMTYLGLLAHQTGDQAEALDLTTRALLLAEKVDARREQAMTLMHRAHALAALGRYAEALRDYETSYHLRLELGEAHLGLEALAGIARVQLALGNLSAARQAASELNEAIQQTPALFGTDEPLRLYLSCIQVFETSGQSNQAAALREKARALLQTRANDLDEESRAAYLSLPTHQILLQG